MNQRIYLNFFFLLISCDPESPSLKFVPPADAQLWCVFRARFALSKEGFCFKLIAVRRIFIKSVVSHPMIIRESPHSI